MTLDSPGAVNAEIRWVAREAIALRGDPDPGRRARFMERKLALLDVIDKSPAELQLDGGHGNYVGAGAEDEATGGGRPE